MPVGNYMKLIEFVSFLTLSGKMMEDYEKSIGNVN